MVAWCGAEWQRDILRRDIEHDRAILEALPALRKAAGPVLDRADKPMMRWMLVGRIAGSEGYAWDRYARVQAMDPDVALDRVEQEVKRRLAENEALLAS